MRQPCHVAKLNVILENNAAGDGQAEGFTKDTPLKPDESEAAMSSIEKAANPRQMISF